jgi:hypothetical protein
VHLLSPRLERRGHERKCAEHLSLIPGVSPPDANGAAPEPVTSEVAIGRAAHSAGMTCMRKSYMPNVANVWRRKRRTASNRSAEVCLPELEEAKKAADRSRHYIILRFISRMDWTGVPPLLASPRWSTAQAAASCITFLSLPEKTNTAGVAERFYSSAEKWLLIYQPLKQPVAGRREHTPASRLILGGNVGTDRNGDSRPTDVLPGRLEFGRRRRVPLQPLLYAPRGEDLEVTA